MYVELLSSMSGKSLFDSLFYVTLCITLYRVYNVISRRETLVRYPWK